MAAIVVQFGLAMIPLGRSSMACGLTSLTTSGTSGSMRQALELSMTTAPASAKRGACAREPVAPAENSAMSTPVGSAVATSSTTTLCPPNSSDVPAERAVANRRSSRIGNDGKSLCFDAAGGFRVRVRARAVPCMPLTEHGHGARH